VRGVEHAGRGAAVEGLGQDGRARGAGELLGDVARVMVDRDDQGAGLRDREADPVQGLAQQGAWPQKAHVLLGPVVAGDLTDQRPQPEPLTAREDHRPAVLLPGHADPARGSEGVHLVRGQQRCLVHALLLASRGPRNAGSSNR
jgi:hypothetical protein